MKLLIAAAILLSSSSSYFQEASAEEKIKVFIQNLRSQQFKPSSSPAIRIERDDARSRSESEYFRQGIIGQVNAARREIPASQLLIALSEKAPLAGEEDFISRYDDSSAGESIALQHLFQGFRYNKAGLNQVFDSLRRAPRVEALQLFSANGVSLSRIDVDGESIISRMMNQAVTNGVEETAELSQILSSYLHLWSTYLISSHPRIHTSDIISLGSKTSESIHRFVDFSLPKFEALQPRGWQERRVQLLGLRKTARAIDLRRSCQMDEKLGHLLAQISVSGSSKEEIFSLPECAKYVQKNFLLLDLETRKNFCDTEEGRKAAKKHLTSYWIDWKIPESKAIEYLKSDLIYPDCMDLMLEEAKVSP
jgi:hypothetical protein